MKSYSTAEIVRRFKDLRYVLPDFHLVGIRSKADVPDSFDDKLYVVDTVNHRLLEASCTTNPGVYWLQNFMNPSGTAVLPPGQYLDSWKLGKHKGVYEALVQAKPLGVWRDKNKDRKIDPQQTKDVGMFGINIHRANENAISKVVSKWSAGCTVVNDPSKFKEVIESCKASKKSLFTYTILEEWS